MCSGFLGDVFRIGTAVAAVGVAAFTGNPFAIVAAVGAVTSVVGYYTHSKELQIAGSVIGAVGAIGGLANAAGLFQLSDIGLSNVDFGLGSIANGAAGSVAADGGIPGSFDAAKNAVANAGTVTIDTMPDAVGLAGGVKVPEVSLEASGNPFNPVSNVAANANAPNVIPEAAVNTNVAEGVTPSVGKGLIDQPIAPTFTASGSDTAHLSTFGTENVGGLNPPATPTPTTVDPSAANVAPPVNGAPTTPTADSLVGAGKGLNNPAITVDRATPDVWDKMWKFIDSNTGSRLLPATLMAGGAFLSGATSSLTPAQVAALEAQADANRAAANLSRQQTAMSQQQLANMNAPLPVATHRKPVEAAVTGSVAPAPPQGLINTPPKLAPVTGAPA